MNRTVGIAIATYNRAALTCNVFREVYDDPRVSHVAISDDFSAPSAYRELVGHTSGLSKVAIVRNERNLGSWANKRIAVETCSAEWAALIDSDNTLGSEYLDALWAVPEWDKDTVYLPVRGVPALDYERYSGLSFDRENVAQHLSNPSFQMVLNTGNFFVHRASHLEVSAGAAEEPDASDGIYFIYRWLASGRRALVTPGLSYEHLVHNGHWMKTADQSLVFANELLRRMRENIWETPCAA